MPRNDSSSLSLRTAVAEYLDWHALRGSSPRHRQELERMLTAFADAAGADRPVQEIRREDCASFLRAVQDRGLKPNTLKAYHRVVDAFFNWLLAEERLEVSPMKRVPKPKLPQEQIKPLTSEELSLLLVQPDRKTFTGLRDRAFIALLADTGLRLSEALGIGVGDLDTKARSISVMGKGGKPRIVFYGEAVAGYIRDYLRRRGDAAPEDLLFVNSLGEPLMRFTMSHRLQKYGKSAGLTGKRVSPHTLRHTFAVSWLMGGGDALSLQRLLGHATPTMTSRYVNLATSDLAKLHRTISPLDRLQGQMGSTASPRTQRRKRIR